MAVYRNAKLMHEIHAAVNDTVATSEAFKRMDEVQRGLSASRIDFGPPVDASHEHGSSACS